MSDLLCLYPQSDDEVSELQEFRISEELVFYLQLAEDDFNEGKKCLFATMVWSGAVVLAKALHDDPLARSKIMNATIIEFGAAAGLPSLTACSLGAANVCATDYPSISVIANLKKNVARYAQHDNKYAHDNSDKLHNGIAVIPYKWGEDFHPLLSVNKHEKYDVVLSAECLWHHDSHESLAKSIKGVLKPGGRLYLTFSHHIPGAEDADLRFFDLLKELEFEIIAKTSVQAPKQWSDEQKDIYLYELILSS